MATIYKRNGKGNWQIEWFDHTGSRQKKSSGTTDKQAAQRIANKIEAEVALRVEGVIDSKLDKFAQDASSPIREHILAYVSSMTAKRRSEAHVVATQVLIEKIATASGFDTLGKLNADKVNAYASELLSNGRAARTVQSHLQAIKGFSRWATKTARCPNDPLVTVEIPSVEDDRRLVRRALNHEEWNWLDSITRQSQPAFEMTGQERSMLYATAIQTGLRSNELRSITRGKMHLTVESPFLIAEARSTKNGKPARQYIQPELASELKAYASKKLLGAKVFPMPSKFATADMFRADLQAARQSWLSMFKDPQERLEADASDFLRPMNSENETLDFHSLRHTTATWLIQAGADIKTIQSVLRHSDIKLTLDRYGHLFPGSEAKAISMIRNVFNHHTEEVKTGTYGGNELGNQSPQEPWQHLRQHSACDLVRLHANGSEIAAIDMANISSLSALQNTGSANENIGENPNRPSRIRTYDLRIRNPLLYPTEL
jgi:integrase